MSEKRVVTLMAAPRSGDEGLTGGGRRALSQDGSAGDMVISTS